MIEHKVTANQSFSLLFPLGLMYEWRIFLLNCHRKIATGSGIFCGICISLFEILKYSLSKGLKDIMRFIWLSGNGYTSADDGVEAAIFPCMFIERNSIAVLPPSAAEVHNGPPIAIENSIFAAIKKAAETFFTRMSPAVGRHEPHSSFLK